MTKRNAFMCLCAFLLAIGIHTVYVQGAIYGSVTRVASSCTDSDGDCAVANINSDNNVYEDVNLKTSPYGWLNATDWATDMPTQGVTLTNATLYVNWTNTSTTKTGNVYTEYYNSSGFSSCAGPVDGCHVAECQTTCSITGQTIASLNSIIVRYRGQDLDLLLPALARIDYVYMIVYYEDTPPEWRRQQINDSDRAILSSETINISAEGYDGVGLAYAWLETNESGSWMNFTGTASGNYSSPKGLSDVAATWTQTNFTWKNSSISSGCVGWRIWYNDTQGSVNSTDVGIFFVDGLEPTFVNASANTSSGSVGGTVRFTGYWNDTSSSRFLVDDSASFTDCSYSTTTSCLCSGSVTSPGATPYIESTCDYVLQAANIPNLVWYARVCDALGNCDSNVTHTYDFVDSTNNKAYEKGPAYPSSPTDYTSAASSDDYVNLSLEDNNRWITELADESGENDSQIYIFNITEIYTQVYNLSAFWEGYGETVSGYYTNLSLWNWSSSSWYELDNEDFTSSSDINLTGSRTSSISDFLNTSTGQIALMSSTVKGASSYFLYDHTPDEIQCNGNWDATYTCANTYDNEWDTYGATSGVPNVVNVTVNYTKPAGYLNSSLWQIEDGVQGGNVSIDEACWNLEKLQLAMRSAPIGGEWYCYDGSSWIALVTEGPGSIYEEAMWWNISTSSLYTDYVQTVIGSNASGNITVNSVSGNLTVALDYPITAIEVVQNDTFWINTTVTCVDADCGTVYGVLRFNSSGATPDTNVSTTDTTPFWTSSSNSQSCGSMIENDVCMKNWSVNATGWFLVAYLLDVNFSTSGGVSNNTDNAEVTIINSYQTYYGNVTGNIALADTQSNYMKLFTVGDANGMVFIADSDSDISWGDLVEIGKNTAGSNSTSDFTQIDTILNMTEKTDNLNQSYSTSGSLSKHTESYIVFNKTMSYVPIASNFANSSFYTGIMWDSSDDVDDGEFDSTDKEDLVFAVSLNETGDCYAGSCDYEVMIPYSLKSYKDGTDTVSFYVMYL